MEVELQHQWTTGDNTRTSGEKVPVRTPNVSARQSQTITAERLGSLEHLLSDKVLKHRALSGTLPTHHSNLRQIQRVLLTEMGKRILQAIHDLDQALHSTVGRHLARFSGCGLLLLTSPVFLSRLLPRLGGPQLNPGSLESVPRRRCGRGRGLTHTPLWLNQC